MRECQKYRRGTSEHIHQETLAAKLNGRGERLVKIGVLLFGFRHKYRLADVRNRPFIGAELQAAILMNAHIAAVLAADVVESAAAVQTEYGVLRPVKAAVPCNILPERKFISCHIGSLLTAPNRTCIGCVSVPQLPSSGGERLWPP